MTKGGNVDDGMSLVLKGTRCTEAHRGPKRKAQGKGACIKDGRRISMQKYF